MTTLGPKRLSTAEVAEWMGVTAKHVRAMLTATPVEQRPARDVGLGQSKLRWDPEETRRWWEGELWRRSTEEAASGASDGGAQSRAKTAHTPAPTKGRRKSSAGKSKGRAHSGSGGSLLRLAKSPG